MGILKASWTATSVLFSWESRYLWKPVMPRKRESSNYPFLNPVMWHHAVSLYFSKITAVNFKNDTSQSFFFFPKWHIAVFVFSCLVCLTVLFLLCLWCIHGHDPLPDNMGSVPSLTALCLAAPAYMVFRPVKGAWELPGHWLTSEQGEGLSAPEGRKDRYFSELMTSFLTALTCYCISDFKSL